MIEPFVTRKLEQELPLNNASIILRLTALWAFSEAALGGILHAFKVPFTGLFIGGTAVVLISLIANFSDGKHIIIKSTLIVIIVKGIVSPHTPLAAYFAVMAQGIIGLLLFYNKKYFRLSAFLFGIITLTLSAFQKIIVLTIVFGKNLWASIDVLANFIFNQLSLSKENYDINFSLILISGYGGLHFFAGIFVGYLAGKLPSWIQIQLTNCDIKINLMKENDNLYQNNYKKKKWWKRPTRVFFLIFIFSLFVLSFLYPELGSNQVSIVLIMLIRFFFFIYIWVRLINPLLVKFLHKLLQGKKSAYSTDIVKIISLFPQVKNIIAYSWNITQDIPYYKRIKPFVINSLLLILISNLEVE